MMVRNPELQRNLWLEITAQRLLAVPAIGVLLAFAVGLGSKDQALALRVIGAAGFIGLTVLWGARLAGQALTTEFLEGTWDGQRISGLSAWDMVCGKLLGGASFAWYAGGWCLLSFLGGAVGRLGVADTLMAVFGLIALAVLTQALSLLSALLNWRKLRRVTNTRRRGLGILVVLTLMPWFAHIAELLSNDVRYLIWFDRLWPMSKLLFVSVLLFAGWALLGAYRAMRIELQFRNKPWPWIAFVVFLQIYCAGWINANAGQTTAAIPYLPTILIDTPVLRLLLATGIALSLAYLFLFAEPKDRSRFTRLIADWRAQRRSNVLEALPLWLINAAITVATAALTLLITVTRADASTIIQIAAGTVAVLLYAVRDFTLVLWCNLSGTQRRADAAAAVYLTVLYGVLPIIFWSANWHVLIGLVQPYSAFLNPVWLLTAAIWAAAGADFFRRRWRHTSPAD